MRKISSALAVTAGLCGLCGLVSGSALAATASIGVPQHVIDGTGGREGLRGQVVVSTPSSWIPAKAARSGSVRFTVAAGAGCSATVELETRAAATRVSPKARAQRATAVGSPTVLADEARLGGWLRVVRRDGADHGDVYGLGVVRLQPHRLLDVRAFVWYSGCTPQQVQDSTIGAHLATVLKTAQVHVRVVKN